MPCRGCRSASPCTRQRPAVFNNELHTLYIDTGLQLDLMSTASAGIFLTAPDAGCMHVRPQGSATSMVKVRRSLHRAWDQAGGSRAAHAAHPAAALKAVRLNVDQQTLAQDGVDQEADECDRGHCAAT
jgi:hypothetical protein